MYWLCKIIGTIPLFIYFRPKIKGLMSVPKAPLIFASNHLSVLDSFVLPLVYYRKIYFIGKMEYFNGKGFSGWFKKFFFTSVGVTPVNREGGSKAQGALERGFEILQSKKPFGIYPEGTRSPDGRLYKGHTGVARVAFRANVPVVPVAMINMRKIQLPGQYFPRPHRPGVTFCEAIYPAKYVPDEDLESFNKGTYEPTREILRQMTDDIMESIQKASGQTYISDHYAKEFK
ncbi:MAG: 1-acyl-sn-glycerol-3-phosphate acyltransferase [Bifidobacteriaceae bacterium]|jgi:1-acyl-sn-glycerol-3-phosphate acyltransferase|nr:1-acyl-sn-glycerol-3-phosphate acyltransferase [Bifidobacteriaceae bacterium]